MALTLGNDNSRKKRLSPIAIGLLLSLGLHVIALLVHFAPSNRFVPDNAPPIEITSYPPDAVPQPPQAPAKAKLPPTKTKELEVAESEETKNKEEDPKAKFLSDKTQTAEQELKARKNDAFQKKLGTGEKAGAEKAKKAPMPIGEPIPEDAMAEQGPSPMTGAHPKKDWKDLSLKDLSVENGDGGKQAATDDRLRGVDDGDHTVLSTREFKFFSYYHRIKELLRQYWRPNVERQLAKLWTHGKSVQEDEMVTQVLVLLDDKGMIQKISRVGTSGVQELDDAAVDAFQKAAPFPNPPKGMVETDGFVRIRWDFILKTEAAPRIQFRSAGGPP